MGTGAGRSWVSRPGRALEVGVGVAERLQDLIERFIQRGHQSEWARNEQLSGRGVQPVTCPMSRDRPVEDAHLGLAEAVDALLGIADHKEPATGARMRQGIDDLALQLVDILELVHHQVADAGQVGGQPAVPRRLTGVTDGSAAPGHRNPTPAARLSSDRRPQSLAATGPRHCSSAAAAASSLGPICLVMPLSTSFSVQPCTSLRSP